MKKKHGVPKKKIQLILLCGICLLLLAAVIALKASKEDTSGQEEDEAESYQVIGVDKGQVTKISITGGDQSVTLTKEGEDWKVEGDESVLIENSLVEDYLEKASSFTSDLKIENVTDMTQYGLEDAALTVELQCGGKGHTIKVGDYNSMISSYYVRIDDEDTVYTIDSSQYYSLNNTLEDFQQH